jgi:hypothetical protein
MALLDAARVPIARRANTRRASSSHSAAPTRSATSSARKRALDG